MDITTLVSDSRLCCRTALFVAMRGPRQDGHAYVAAAYASGCRAFVCEYSVDLPPDAVVAYVPDGRRAMALLAAKFYGDPAQRLTLIGITGTKGKTTTALMLYHLLSESGLAAGYIGSGGVLYAGRQENTENTTPAAREIHRILGDMCRAHVRAVVIEVSSQALVWQRVFGLRFPIAVFTNLAPDHIGAEEHPDFSHYREAKARLFADYGCRTMITNADDETSAYMVADSSAGEVVAVSCHQPGAALLAGRIRKTRRGLFYATAFSLYAAEEGEIPAFIPLPGECNVSNAMLALCAARACLALYEKPCSLRTLAPLLADVSVPGRFSPIKTAQAGVEYLIDYAHNGYSLRAAITALRAYDPVRLVCLFGSVGDRTYSRRTELGQAACLADFCIVTTDDPGSEAPADTMREICRVLDEAGKEYIAIPDRAEAIRYAVTHAQPGDMVLLCGKGHEQTQLIGRQRIPFSEKELLLAAVNDALPVL